MTTLPGEKSLAITLLDSALLSYLEKMDALFTIEATAVHTTDKEKERRTAAVLNFRVFHFYATKLLYKLKTGHEKAFPTSKSTCKEFLSGQMAQKRTLALSVRATFLSTMSVLS